MPLRLDAEVCRRASRRAARAREGRAIARLAVDAQLAVVAVLRELERVAVREGELRDLDPLRAHAPEVALLPRGRRPGTAGSMCCSTASASGERSPSPLSSSTITSPFGSVVNSTRSPVSAGAVTVIATSHSFGPTPEPSTTPALANPDFGGSTGCGGGGRRCSSEHLAGIEPSLPEELLVERLLLAPEEPH